MEDYVKLVSMSVSLNLRSNMMYYAKDVNYVISQRQTKQRMDKVEVKLEELNSKIRDSERGLLNAKVPFDVIANLYIKGLARVIVEIEDETKLKLQMLDRLRKVANLELRKELLHYQLHEILGEWRPPFFHLDLSELEDTLRMQKYDKEVLDLRVINVEIKPEDECSICMQPQVSGITILSCGHNYHHHCITKWLMERSPKCPQCREYFVINL